MKKFTSLLISCSLALAVSAMAQVPEEQGTPKEKQEKTQGAEAKPGAKAAKPEATTAHEHGPKTEGATTKALKTESTPKTEMPKTEKLKSEKTTGAGAESKVSAGASGEAAVSATPHGKGAKAAGAGAGAGINAKASPSATAATATSSATVAPAKGAKKAASPVTAGASATPATTATAAASATPVTAAASATPAAAASASATATVAASGQTTTAAAAKTPDPQQVQQIQTQHETFKAQPKPNKVPAVTFSASYRIQGSDRWQGPQYEVYRSYRPERHDRSWYSSHYTRVELIAGGYYYWNSGYWYPAWGYDSSAEYYAYDAPIYVGHRALPPDRVIADVQAVLQNMGYYKGEVDGLLGPLTREALTAYQADRGMIVTAVIDQPTLDSLGMG